MRVKFTERLLRSARLREGSAQGWLSDTELPRFGATINARAVSFFVNLDIPGPRAPRGGFKTRRKVIGKLGQRFPDGSVMTLKRAREIARAVLRGGGWHGRCPLCRQRL